MLEKKRQDKIRTTTPLEKTLAEILVANGRAVEPFVKIFTYSGENVTKSPLGTLVGVFEIVEQSEDSAYIVNFLASVAKKEYFNNPRRSAIESFEAALHKINLALAELVKHGNIAWLGKFHGALGILEKNSLHFSVTGEAKILLSRNNSLSEISVGLASEESSIHPIKTFVEVSSGHLLPQDKIIFTSPELLDILPIEDLEKNALRMDTEHFGQFLRTVLINELDMAGTVIIDFQEGKLLPSPQKQEEKTTETPLNAFSQNAFIPKIKAPETNSLGKENQEEAPVEEYIDSKTGHIYVQGDTLGKTEANQNLERVKLSLQNIFHGLGSFFVSQGKLMRKVKKQSLILFSALAKTNAVATRKTTRFIRKQLRKLLSPKKLPVSLPASAPQTEPDTVSLPEKPTSSTFPILQPITPTEKKTETPPAAPMDMEIPPFMRAKLAAFYQKNGVPEPLTPLEKSPVQNFTSNVHTILSFVQKISQKGFIFFVSSGKKLFLTISALFNRMFFSFKNVRPQQQKFILLGGAICIIILTGGIFFLKRPPKGNSIPAIETSKPQTEASIFPLATEKNARLLETPITLATQENSIVASVLLGNETYLITKKNIIGQSDKKQYMLPGNGSALLAAPMDHLSLIFIYTDTGELFAWSPISRTFVKNTLTLPEGAAVKDIGTYLTYLYVLDGSTNQIYRFPRAEGGFGQGSTWLKDSVAFDKNAKMTVNETIFLAPNNLTVQAFFRGRLVKNLESPNTPLSITSLYTHPGLANVYALDTQNKRILVWNQDGALLTQYFSDMLADATTITVNERTNEVLITTPYALLSFKINTEQ